MASNLPTTLSKDSQSGILEFQRQCYNMLNAQWNVREQLRMADLAYMREQDQTREKVLSKLSNRYGDADKLQNITIPVVLPAVEAAVTYQSSVFLSGKPIFGCVSDPSTEDAAMQIEALMDNHAVRGGWTRHIQMFLRDGFKYNLSAIEATWTRISTYSVETDAGFAGGKEGRPKEIIWEGNMLNRIDPYNMFWDTRVPITQVSQFGEFFGWTELKSRTALKMLMAALPDKMVANVVAAFSSGMGGINTNTSSVASYYVPPLNPDSVININTAGVGTQGKC